MAPVVRPQARDPGLPLNRRANCLACQREITLEATHEESVRLRKSRIALERGHGLARP